MDRIPHPEHPRPDLERPVWHSLNGQWEFAPDPEDRGLREEWWERASLPERITVPYPVGSELAGVEAIDAPHTVYWYLRRFDLPPEMHGRYLYLHFGAADHHARVWLNGLLLGDHHGGYDPFEFDASEAVRPHGNRLVVRVTDSRSLRLLRGKQTWRRQPFSIFYPGISGLWQSVWLEAAGPTRLMEIRLYPDLKAGCFHLRAAVERPAVAAYLNVEVTAPGGVWQEPVLLRAMDGRADGVIPLRQPETWSPDGPHLYEFELVLRTADGVELDRVRTYSGLRQIAVRDGRILLNDRPLYQRLVLVQGYYPGGVYTPANDDGYRRDVEAVKALGFNGLRMHQKLEAPRFLYWCDRLGVLVWSEIPSAYWPGIESRRQVRELLPAMIGRDGNHPAIIAWVLFNESWGTHDLNWSAGARSELEQLVREAHNLDPSRLVVDNSGFDHLETDIMDIHHYLADLEQAERLYDSLLAGRLWRHSFLPGLRYLLQPTRTYKPPLAPGARYEGQPIIVSEYGGFGHYESRLPGDLLERYQAATRAIASRPGFQGHCYTQLYDTYQERNGLLTFERRPKVPPEELRAFNQGLRAAE